MKKLYAALILTIAFWPAVLTVYSSEAGSENIFIRPQVEYKASSLRDPFKEDILKKDKPEAEIKSPVSEPLAPLPEMDVQGLIWGGNFPQAIINNKVYVVGDLIEGAEILSIDKKGIKLSSAAGIFDLVAPGLSSVLDENAKDLATSSNIEQMPPGTDMPTMTTYANNPVLNNINKEEPK